MNTNTTQRATNHIITWRKVRPGVYDAYEPHERYLQPDDVIMTVDGKDIAKLHFQSNHWWKVSYMGRRSALVSKQGRWWPNGKGWMDYDDLMKEMELAVEELLECCE
jgi:hypothetical protein